MTETPQGPELPKSGCGAVPRRRWSLSLVWLIPIVAAVIGGWLAVKGILERGPTVTIGFNTAKVWRRERRASSTRTWTSDW